MVTPNIVVTEIVISISSQNIPENEDNRGGHICTRVEIKCVQTNMPNSILSHITQEPNYMGYDTDITDPHVRG